MHCNSWSLETCSFYFNLYDNSDSLLVQHTVGTMVLLPVLALCHAKKSSYGQITFLQQFMCDPMTHMVIIDSMDLTAS